MGLSLVQGAKDLHVNLNSPKSFLPKNFKAWTITDSSFPPVCIEQGGGYDHLGFEPRREVLQVCLGESLWLFLDVSSRDCFRAFQNLHCRGVEDIGYRKMTAKEPKTERGNELRVYSTYCPEYSCSPDGDEWQKSLTPDQLSGHDHRQSRLLTLSPLPLSFASEATP